MTPPVKPDPLYLDNCGSTAGRLSQKSQLVSVSEGYAMWAAAYDQAPNTLLALEERELESLLPSLGDKFALDVACGTGRWLSKLILRGAQAGIGLDLSFEMLTCASSKLSLRGKLIQADACSIPLRSSLADLVVSSFTVGYVENLRAFAGELMRVTRPGAKLFVSDFHPSAHFRGWRRMFRSGDEVLEVSSHVRTVEQIYEAFAAQGFVLGRRLEPSIGEPERALFKRAGKEHLFDAAREGPAIFVCEFRRSSTPPK